MTVYVVLQNTVFYSSTDYCCCILSYTSTLFKGRAKSLPCGHRSSSCGGSPRRVNVRYLLISCHVWLAWGAPNDDEPVRRRIVENATAMISRCAIILLLLYYCSFEFVGERRGFLREERRETTYIQTNVTRRYHERHPLPLPLPPFLF